MNSTWSQLSHYLICISFILNKEHFTFQLQYKYSGTFANNKYEEMSIPKIKKMCDPILASDTIENATPL